MKKIVCVLLTGLLIAFAGCGEKLVSTNKSPAAAEISQSQNTYFLEGSLENGVFTGVQRTNYVNTEQQPLNELYFHLYPNIYADTSLMDEDFLLSSFPDGFDKGGIEIEEVALLETPLNFEAEKHLLKIILNEPLKPMESAVITFKYKTFLPKGLDRFGYYDTCYKLTSFYPVAVVYENGWKLEQLSAIGDPAFSDMADYHFTLRVPSGFTVAATGEKELISSDENGDTYKITAKNVRDMAVVADTRLKEYEAKAGETTIKTYAYTDEQAELLKAYAADSLSFFGNAFGVYPYSTYSVVTARLFSGGMEYPTLALVSHQLFDSTEKAFLEWTVAHETAHQWWYGLVGSNPVTEAFMDESLTEYSTLQYIRNKYDEETYEKMKSTFILLPYSAYNAFYEGKAIARPISEYKSMLEFSMLVYVKGCMMFMDMENIMGKDALMQALKSYYETYAYSSASFSDFKEHLSQSYEYDWNGFFKKWLEQG